MHGRDVDEGCGLPQTERKGDWMQTYTGRQYWPLDPQPDDVDLRDIVHHLSMLCRYCGACRRFYSVLEHSLGVAYVAERQARRLLMGPRRRTDVTHRALFHDAPESYVHDPIRPIKRCISGYEEVESANARAINIALFLPPCERLGADVIKLADNAMLLAEQAALMAPAPAKWAPVSVPREMREDAARYLRTQRWLPWRRSRWWLKRRFTKLHYELAEA